MTFLQHNGKQSMEESIPSVNPPFQFQFGPGFNFLGEMMNRPFVHSYECYSVSMLPGNERHDVEKGGKIIMPPSALDQVIKIALLTFSFSSLLLFLPADPSQCRVPDAVQVDQPGERPTDTRWRVRVRGGRGQSLPSPLGAYLVSCPLINPEINVTPLPSLPR